MEMTENETVKNGFSHQSVDLSNLYAKKNGIHQAKRKFNVCKFLQRKYLIDYLFLV